MKQRQAPTVTDPARASARRRGLMRWFGRLMKADRRPPRATTALLPAGTPAVAARDRAQRALLEARQAMGGVIGEPSPAGDPLSPDLERLQAHLEELERDRASLRAELEAIRATVLALQARLDAVERHTHVSAVVNPVPATDEVEAGPVDAGPAHPAEEGAAAPPPATGEGAPAPDDPGLRDLRERVLRALRERVFAAGTVGTRIELTPPPSDSDLDTIIDRFHSEPLVEHAELIESGEDAALLRVTLRTALRWDQFSPVLERALGRALGPGEASWAQGTVRVRRNDER